MDTSNPSVFVNAELLRLHVGKRVRAVIQFMRLDGGSVIGRSTDEQQIIVKGHPPQPYTAFMEVIGIADSNQSIRAEIWSNFGDTFGILHILHFSFSLKQNGSSTILLGSVGVYLFLMLSLIVIFFS